MPKYDFGINPPYLNAAGSLGFAPRYKPEPGQPSMGALVTTPISLAPRTPSQGPRFAAYPGGFLLHTGYPNPGLSAVIRLHAAAWSRSPLPVIVHILGQSPAENAQMVQRLETLENVIGVEVGLPPGVSAVEASAMAKAVVGETLVIIRLPMEQALELAPLMIDAGAAAVSLGAPRGALPAVSGKIIEGRLYGPAVFPHALQVVRSLTRQNIPVIAAGGVYSQAQSEIMLEAGAAAVQFDSFLWT